MKKKTVKATKTKKKTFSLSADLGRLEEVANVKFHEPMEARNFFKGMTYTAIAMWMQDPRSEEEETILTDTLAALMYVQI